MKPLRPHPQGRAAGPRLAVFNVALSPNLGDGLLSDCLEYALVRQGADPGSRVVDLAGRTSRVGAGAAGWSGAKVGLSRLPPALRARVVRSALALEARRTWTPHYAAGMNGADSVIIGGGNLLSDHDLNFPTKLALVLDLAAARDLPVSIYGCGMAERWSDEGERRLRRALAGAGLRSVFLRDAASCRRWDARFAEASGCRARLTPDPGVLAAAAYGPAQQSAGRPVIGLGLISHLAIRYHADTRLTEAALGRWFTDLALALKVRGAEVVAFTNGAPEDRETARRIAPDLAARGVPLIQPETPADLSRLCGSCNAIAAYRMHAVIAAYAHGVPALALKWDDKLDAFMASVARPDWLADPVDIDPAAAAIRLLEAASAGVDPARQAAVVAQAMQGVGQVASDLMTLSIAS